MGLLQANIQGLHGVALKGQIFFYIYDAKAKVGIVCHFHHAYPEIAKILHMCCSYPKGDKICYVLYLLQN